MKKSDVLKLIGDPREVSRSLVQKGFDETLLNTIRRKQPKRYRNKHVAVADGEVVGYGKDRNRLITRLSKRGMNLDRVTIGFIGKDRTRWYFPVAA